MKCGGCQGELSYSVDGIPVILMGTGLYFDCPLCKFRTQVPIEDFIDYEKVADKLSEVAKRREEERKSHA